jgi:hypothetical protein
MVSPHDLPAELAAELLPAPRRSYTDELNDIVLLFRVEAWRQRRLFEAEFCALAKEVHHGLRSRLFPRSRRPS